MVELQTVKDIAIIFQKQNVFQKNQERWVFKKALQAIGGNNLVVKLDKYVARGKLFLNYY